MVVLAAGTSVEEPLEPATQTGKWHENGTLRGKSALEWQAAPAWNKLATCAELISTMWREGHLRPAIADRLSGVDDIRPYARRLVKTLDTALEAHPDLEQNREEFAHQTVVTAAKEAMIELGWTK